MEGVAGLAPRLRPPVQLADPVPRHVVGPPFAGLELSVFPDAHTEAPRSSALAHPTVRDHVGASPGTLPSGEIRTDL
jgi:hypothetical protein